MEAKFIHMSDLHLFAESIIVNGKKQDMSKKFQKALSDIEEKHSDADFILISGDLVDDGSIEGYRYFKEICRKIRIPVHFCLGNHDDRKNFNEVFFEVSEERPYYYSSSLKEGLRLITLDTGRFNPWMGEISEKQLIWLKETLKEEKIKTIILLHHPPFIGDDMDSLLYQLKNSRALYEIIKQHDIKAVFSGHIHAESSYLFGHIPAFTARGTGFGLGFKADFSAFPTNETGYDYCILRDNGYCIKSFITDSGR